MSMTEITIQDLKNLCINTSKNLLRMLNEKEEFSKVSSPNLETRLIFPKYERKNNNPIRHSEQEARVQFILALERYYKEIFYSIETPTDYNYSFSGKKFDEKKDKENKPKCFPDLSEGASAQFDLSLFIRSDNNLEQIVDIEFKSQSPTPGNIGKDLLKLFAEDRTGLFFHIIYSNSSKALDNDLNKFADESKNIADYLRENNIKPNSRNVLFVFCVINEKKVFIKECTDWQDENIFKNFFNITNNNNWEIINL